MPLPADDLEWMFKDSGGVLVYFDTHTTWMHFDIVDVELFPSARSIGATLTGTFETGKLPGLTTDSRIRVSNETQYDVRQAPYRRADGTSVVLLSEV